MAIIKCKMCGGDLELIAGSTVAECEYCGTRQTVPNADNEKKLTLFARANRLRAACDFDKAAGIYESIVADFPEEAEAYWGLVLCKYGIEYVDDPATGKKIPTCHRSGFDSVLEDTNYEQAMENADMMAQGVYRDEAKQLEQLRKDIISVSSGEKPYDIFICYKETDAAGGRTLDSVLAQDLYSALTDKGYRVFFSRITLQGKLGQAYEPYIFAALHSAKVMLAVGTRYEYYTAVWVKNEWSRYLKLMAQDKGKHLIPCYKDLDPEDMPKEFSHLQGADLGKMGAVQDILFNMEKYIPLQKETVVHEQVIIESGSTQKIASLLDRGRMALEDGDFANADGFFEQVLNNDSKNGRAYLGKFLANQRCGSIMAYRGKSLRPIHEPKQTRYRLEPDQEHIDRIVAYYGDSFARKYNLQKLYRFDLQYMSVVPSLQQAKEQELQRWSTDKLLSKAVQFADEELASELSIDKEFIETRYEEAIQQATEQEKAALEDLKARYAAHLATVDKQAAAHYEQELVLMEQRYNELLQLLAKADSQRSLRNLAEDFEKLGSFRDSKDQAAACRDKAMEMDYQAGIAKLQKATSERDLTSAGEYFTKLGDYRDCQALAQQCAERAAQIRSQVLWQQEQERQRREKVAAINRSRAKKLLLIYVVLAVILFAVSVYGQYQWGISNGNAAENDDVLSSIIASAVIQGLMRVLPNLFFILQMVNRGKKDKAATAFQVLTLIFACLGILVWGIVIGVSFGANGNPAVRIWALSSLLFNVTAITLSFFRKR